LNTYRLVPIEPGSADWQFTKDYDVVWACAPNPASARTLVAAKTGMIVHNAEALESPWEDEAITSCALDPTMWSMRAETWSSRTAVWSATDPNTRSNPRL